MKLKLPLLSQNIARVIAYHKLTKLFGKHLLRIKKILEFIAPHFKTLN